MDALCRALTLHQAEIDAIALARQMKADLLLTDDTAARLAAGSLGLPVHGTIGIVVRAIRRKQRSPADVIRVLQSIPTTSTLHVKRTFLDQIIQHVKAETGLP